MFMNLLKICSIIQYLINVKWVKLSASGVKKDTENQNKNVSCVSNGIIMFSANCKSCNSKEKKLVKKSKKLVEY